MVSGTFRTITCAPGWPQAVRNSAGTAGRGLAAGELAAGELAAGLPHAATLITAPARHSMRRSPSTIIGRVPSPSGSAAIYPEPVTRGSLAVAADWLGAVNDQDTARVAGLSAEDIEIAGPRGSAHGREVLAGWLARAGFAADARRWFCGAGGSVVVEQDARWIDPATGAGAGRARVASRFVIRGENVAVYQRHHTLDAALAAAGLTAADEVTGSR